MKFCGDPVLDNISVLFGTANILSVFHPVLDNIFVLFWYYKYSLCVVLVLQQIHPLCSSGTGKIFAFIRYWEKVCVHLVLAKICVHLVLVLGKNLCSSGTEKKELCVHPVLGKVCVHPVLGKKKSAFIWY
jgi:hypothetical protein